jgi:predicted SAM-dependent methyltransferase
LLLTPSLLRDYPLGKMEPLHKRLTMPTAAPAKVFRAASPRLRLLPYLNLGCGDRCHPGWVNVDLQPRQRGTVRLDVSAAPLPYVDGSFAVVYHSHLLEHVPPARLDVFLGECWRVLKPGGIVRVVVPDLEQLADLYVQTVERAWQGDSAAGHRHHWLVLEMIDQLVREHSGGRMLEYLADLPGDTCEFVLSRLGADGPRLLRTAAARTQAANFGWRQRWQQRLRGWIGGGWRERLLRWLLGKEYDILTKARFRQSGEIHRWMYDRVSLRAALEAAGFDDIRLVGPKESAIPDWTAFHLDTLPDGSVAKPDSLFMEGKKI